MRIRALVAIVGLLLTTVTVEALAVTQVKSMRLWRAPDNTRLVFDLSGPVQHSVFTLSAPGSMCPSHLSLGSLLATGKLRFLEQALLFERALQELFELADRLDRSEADVPGSVVA